MERIVIAVLRHPQVLWRYPLFILAACLALVLRGTKVLLTVVRHHPLNEPACKCPFMPWDVQHQLHQFLCPEQVRKGQDFNPCLQCRI